MMYMHKETGSLNLGQQFALVDLLEKMRDNVGREAISDGPIEWTVTEGPDVYLIKIGSDRSATSYVNEIETGRFQLSRSEIDRILNAKTSDEAFAVLEE